MSEWKEYKLGDAVKFGNGKVRPNSLGEIPVYGGNGILDFCNEFNYEDETIIIGRVGAYCGAIFYETRPIWVSDNALAAKPKENFNAKFLYYFLKNLELNQFAEGSSHPLVTQSLLNSIDIVITDNEYEQSAIASILSSLDDKIDLLHHQNKTLEALAETLFRQWFVDKKTSLGKLGSLVSATLGGEWGKENLGGDYILPVYCIRGTDIADLQSGLATKIPLRFVKEKKYKNIELQNGDLIMEISGGSDGQATGRTIYINEKVKNLFNYPLVFSNFCRLIRPKKMEYSFYLFSYIRMLYSRGDFFNLEKGSSGIRNFDYKAFLNEIEYEIHDENSIKEFSSKVFEYFQKINKNKYQIRTLTQLRNTLLPKLMSGEVRVRH